MKALIWIGCFFVDSVFTELLKMQGITLGGIPTFIHLGITMLIAKALCKRWDEHKQSRGR